MADKRAPLGICDQCGGPIPADQWYTSKGRPRLHCSLDCRQTANSRAGAPIRSQEMREHVAAGEWVNPRSQMTAEQISALQRQAARKARTREVADGRWRNPALGAAARSKLSRPRRHQGALHQAMEKLKRGLRVSDCTPDEQAAYREYRRQLRLARRADANAYRRTYDRQRWEAMTEAERETARAKWRQQNKRKKQKGGG